MPTQKQIDWLKDLLSGKIKKRDDPHKYSVYRKRIRDGIDKQLEMIRWISINCPDILTDEEFEIQLYGSLRHRRLRTIMEILDNITPEANPVLMKARRITGRESSTS